MGLFDSVGDFFSGAAKAVGSLAGPLLGFAGGKMQVEGQQQANIMNAEEAKKQRDWQEYMSNTAHQREMNDLRTAGLNPILTATGGSGAGTPSGAMATMKNPYEGIGDTISSARRIDEIEKAQLKQTEKRIENETDLKESTVKLNEMAGQNQYTQAGKNWSEEMLNSFLIEKTNSEKELNELKKITELDNQKLLRASAAEKISGVSLNSAYAKKTLAEAGLRGYDLTEREYLHQVKKYTGPAREVFDTAGDAVDVIVPFKPREYRRVP